MSFKFKTTIDGKEVEVTAPEGSVTKDQLTESYIPSAVHNHELARQRKAAEGLVKADDLLKDEQFRTKALETWGVKGGKQNDPEAQKALRTQWETEVLTPVVTERDSLLGEREAFLVERLQRELLESSALVGVKPVHMKPRGGAAAPIVAMYQDLFGWDPETRAWYVMLDAERFAPSIKGTKDRPYKTPAEFFEDLAKDKDWAAEYLADQRQRGADLQGRSELSLSGNDVVLTPEQAEDHSQYQKAQELARKQGGVVRVKAAGT